MTIALYSAGVRDPDAVENDDDDDGGLPLGRVTWPRARQQPAGFLPDLLVMSVVPRGRKTLVELSLSLAWAPPWRCLRPLPPPVLIASGPLIAVTPPCL